MNDELVLEFVKCINEHDVTKLSQLMTEDHIFTDAHNNSITGKNELMLGWQEYFKMFPDYKIEIDEFYSCGDVFAMFGFASGTYKGCNPEHNHWKLPAAWKALVIGGKLSHWQVYCDTAIPSGIMEKAAKIR
ncbi:MAG: nuclear transport factor 2 family protein [Ignavibacteria bacterium]|nr:nuclear transport factor 2 family protein [Ignavibacteria bacterium]MCC7159049.1 nuclear transport factor 2 family protein [Ignavibacteria bacterium]